MQVRERMTANPIVIQPKTSCPDAFHLMQEKRIRRLPVVDQNGFLVGIVTEKDLLYASPMPATSLSIHEIGYLLAKMPVERVMTRQVITVQDVCPLEEAARIMLNYKIGGLPVMRERHLVGLLTETDILRVMMEALGGCSEGLRITIYLPEDRGELGAMTDAIIQMGGELTSLVAFWGRTSSNRLITLKVHGVNTEELIQTLQNMIGVQVIDYQQSAELRPDLFSSTEKMGIHSMPNLNSRHPWFWGQK